MPLPGLLPCGAPDPDRAEAMPGHPRVAFLKTICTRPNIVVGDYSYYDDPAGPERFQDDNVLYHFAFMGDVLRIGRFCALAAGTTFLMNGGNHATAGISTFPFAIFGGAWADPPPHPASFPHRGDTVVEDDVWFGWRSVVMPGVRIGSGAIVAAGAMVTHDVPPYAVVAGNPARVVKMRFSDADVARLLAVAWWDWPVDVITKNIAAITGGDIDALEAVSLTL